MSHLRAELARDSSDFDILEMLWHSLRNDRSEICRDSAQPVPISDSCVMPDARPERLRPPSTVGGVAKNCSAPLSRRPNTNGQHRRRLCGKYWSGGLAPHLAELRAQNMRMGKLRVQRLKQKLDLKSCGKRHFRAVSTDSTHGLPISPNGLDTCSWRPSTRRGLAIVPIVRRRAGSFWPS